MPGPRPRIERRASWPVLAAGLALAAIVGSVARANTTCEGDWETVIASPERPWIFTVHLRSVAGAWSGSMSVEGLAEFPLREVRADSGRVHFELPPELDGWKFDGVLQGDRITGRTSAAGEPIPTTMKRVVRPPPPRDRIEAWRQDLDDASERLSKYDRSFSPRARARLHRAVERLKTELPRLGDEQVLVGLSRAVARAGNAHTWLRLDPTRQGLLTTQFPIRIWWFEDGPYVIKAEAPYRRALRCRLVAIDGHDVARARKKISTLFAGNVSWGDYLTPIYLTCPDMLYGLGLTRSREEASFTFEDERGGRFQMQVRAEPIDRDAMPDESWQDLSPLTVTGKPPWTSALEANTDSLPLYLRHPRQPYWFDYQPGSRLLYFQYNRSADADSGPSFSAFGDSLLAFAAAHAVDGVVVDLRLNSGGNLQVAKAFMRSLGTNPRFNQRGHLFVIVGNCTYSAGLYHAAQLRQLTEATFVGEDVGDRLDFWAEGGEIVLPNSGVAIAYANGFHRYSGRSYPANEPYYETLSVSSLRPDIPAAVSSVDYFMRRDPALETIEARSGR